MLMRKIVQILVALALLFPVAGFAQSCVDFESQGVGSQFGNGINGQGDIIFVENGIHVTVEYFEWVGGGGTFGNCDVIDGTSVYGTGNAMWTSNINLGFDFFALGFVPNKVSFDFNDSGGNENISVNGSTVFVGELMMAIMPSGISIGFTNMGSYMRATLTGPITSLMVGGQEFSIDNVCAEYIEDPNECVDFELLPLGAQYGNGINTQGDVIFTENDIPVSVEYFEWIGGGGTFGTCNVVDVSGSIGTGQGMWTSNINLRFNLNNLGYVPNWVTFDFGDYGVEENISVNGSPVYVGELMGAVLPSDVSFYIADYGTFHRATIICLDGISEFMVGGQEFEIDNICHDHVNFDSYCVDFETLALGSMYGTGINSPGDVIFTQNSIPVSVEEFLYVTGGTTFGFAEVMNSSGIGTGQDMRLGNINLMFDFDAIGMIPDFVTFDFADYGGEENLGINDEPIFAGELTMATVPPGFVASFSMSGDIGQCIITGPVEKLIVGGQEFFIDNVCAHFIQTSIGEPAGQGHADAVLGQNYPNPFSGITQIPFSVKESTHVKISVFDQLGREVEVLADQEYLPGDYQLSWDAGQAANGIYFCRLKTGQATQGTKLIIRK